MNHESQRNAMNYFWHKGVIQCGLPLAILFLLAMVAFAVASGDWSAISGMLAVQSIIFFAIIGYCIGMLRYFLSRRRSTNKD